MIENARRDSENISRNWVKVSIINLYCVQPLNMQPIEKREAAQKAETDFFALLRESGIAKQDAVWKEVRKSSSVQCMSCHLVSLQVKHSISRDPRYDAVGSSTLREELFNTFLKAHGSTAPLEPNTAGVDHETVSEDARKDSLVDKKREKQERRERAVREREERVKAERSQVEASIDRSRLDLNKEEGELAFRCAMCLLRQLRSLAHPSIDGIGLHYRTMLTDAIRDPTVRLLHIMELCSDYTLCRLHGMVSFRS